MGAAGGTGTSEHSDLFFVKAGPELVWEGVEGQLVREGALEGVRRWLRYWRGGVRPLQRGRKGPSHSVILTSAPIATVLPHGGAEKVQDQHGHVAKLPAFKGRLEP